MCTLAASIGAVSRVCARRPREAAHAGDSQVRDQGRHGRPASDRSRPRHSKVERLPISVSSSRVSAAGRRTAGRGGPISAGGKARRAGTAAGGGSGGRGGRRFRREPPSGIQEPRWLRTRASCARARIRLVPTRENLEPQWLRTRASRAPWARSRTGRTGRTGTWSL